MAIKSPATLCLVLLLLAPCRAWAQKSIAIGASSERVQLSSFWDKTQSYFSGLAEVALDPRNGIEVAVGRFETTQTQPGWTPSDGEAPLKVGLKAHPIQLTYRRAFAPWDRPLQPVLRVGGDWVRVVDTYWSDTPADEATSSAVGMHVGAEFRILLGGEASISIGAEYKAFRNEGRKLQRIIDLNRGLGVRVGFLMRLGGRDESHSG